mmetsp:Transcript_2189/g.3615  ORF Transcript_2189/g.3615 Transcript_2189/m.3615 type:complete len:117 (-) Transcript_2189:191-541(-)
MTNIGLEVKRIFFTIVAVVVGVVFIVSIAEDTMLLLGFGKSESFSTVSFKKIDESKMDKGVALRGISIRNEEANNTSYTSIDKSSLSEFIPNHSYSEDPQLAAAEALAAREEAREE